MIFILRLINYSENCLLYKFGFYMKKYILVILSLYLFITNNLYFKIIILYVLFIIVIISTNQFLLLPCTSQGT